MRFAKLLTAARDWCRFEIGRRINGLGFECWILLDEREGDLARLLQLENLHRRPGILLEDVEVLHKNLFSHRLVGKRVTLVVFDHFSWLLCRRMGDHVHVTCPGTCRKRREVALGQKHRDAGEVTLRNPVDLAHDNLQLGFLVDALVGLPRRSIGTERRNGFGLGRGFVGRVAGEESVAEEHGNTSDESGDKPRAFDDLFHGFVGCLAHLLRRIPREVRVSRL